MANRRRVRRPFPSMRLECLESRMLLSGTFTVTDTGDAATGQTLRAAILAADAPNGPTTIDFDFTGTAPFVIQPATSLPAITSTVVVNASAQPGYAGLPLIMLDGSKAPASSIGLTIDAPGVSVSGFAIGNFLGEGILIEGSGSDQVIASWIGLSTDGTTAAPNGSAGIVIQGATKNVIGGPTTQNGNVISSNTGSGITMQGGAGSLILHNIIGTSPSGALAAGNGGDGIWLDLSTASIIDNTVTGNGVSGGAGILIEDSPSSVVQGNLIGDDTGAAGNTNDGIQLEGASFVTIGGTTSALGNTISGNGNSGIDLSPDANNPQFKATNALIEGNWIGLNATGAGGFGNDGDGISDRGASNTTIGGTIAGSANVIGSSGFDGIDVQGATATGTAIEGNIIGLAANGRDPAPNGVPHGNSGVVLRGTIGTLVIGNVDSENKNGGIFVIGGYGSVIQGNLLGTDITGTLARPNTDGGIVVDSASLTLIGGTTASSRNVIDSNTNAGIILNNQDGGGGVGNVIAGNFIGVAASGLAALPNDEGIVVDNIPRTTIGLPGAANVISGNNTNGILVFGPSSTGTVIQGDIIGLGADASTPVANMEGIAVSSAPGVLIEQDFISGNSDDGIYVVGSGTAGTVIIQNHIGTDGSGTLARGNGNAGVQIDGAAGVTVGGTGPTSRNIISGNGVIGVQVDGASATTDVIVGNWIGLDTNGIKPLPNKVDGVLLQAPAVLVGGLTPAARNVISGNGSYGISLATGATGDAIAGNWIGLDATGLKAAGNGVAGVFINNTGSNHIGGTPAGWTNVISGNGSAEVQIENANAAGNFVQGNDLGTDATLYNVANAAPIGIYIYDAPGNEIGGASPGAGNFIVGHKTAGIAITDPNSFFNLVIGNVIGPGEFVNSPEANGIGVLINNAGDNTVGGTTPNVINYLRGNAYNPVYVTGANAKGNQTTGNFIG